MFKDWHDRVAREAREREWREAASNPVFHGRAGLRFIDVVGRRFWPIDLLVGTLWWALFVALGVFTFAPETYADWLEAAEKGLRRDLPFDDPWKYFMAWFFLSMVGPCRGLAEHERAKLIAEGRLPLRP